MTRDRYRIGKIDGNICHKLQGKLCMIGQLVRPPFENRFIIIINQLDAQAFIGHIDLDRIFQRFQFRGQFVDLGFQISARDIKPVFFIL